MGTTSQFSSEKKARSRRWVGYVEYKGPLPLPKVKLTESETAFQDASPARGTRRQVQMATMSDQNQVELSETAPRRKPRYVESPETARASESVFAASESDHEQS